MPATDTSKNSPPPTSPSQKSIAAFLPLLELGESAAGTFLRGYLGVGLEAAATVEVLTRLYLCKALLSCGLDTGRINSLMEWVEQDLDTIPFIQILNNDSISVGDRERCMSLDNGQEEDIPTEIFISTSFDVSLMRDKAGAWIQAMEAAQQ